MDIVAKPLDPVVHDHLSHVVCKLLDLSVVPLAPSYERILNGSDLGVREPFCVYVKERIDQRGVCVSVMDSQLEFRSSRIVGDENLE